MYQTIYNIFTENIIIQVYNAVSAVSFSYNYFKLSFLGETILT